MPYVVSVLSLLSMLCGVVFIIIGYSQHNPEKSLFSFKNPFNPLKMRPWFKSNWGYKFGISGGFLLAFGGLLGLVRQWIMKG